MKARLALLVILAVIPTSGCRSPECDQPQEHFEVDEPVTAAELDELVHTSGRSSWDELECDRVCQEVYVQIRGWEIAELDTCELTLPENPDGSGEPGQVTCTGTGIESFCY